MTIASVASAFPTHQYNQSVLKSALQSHWGSTLKNPGLMKRLQAPVGMERRHLALPMEEYYNLKSWDLANNHWIEVAQEIGQKALCGALARAAPAKSDLAALFLVSVVGVCSPSIDARLISRMGLPLNIKRIPIFVWGAWRERPASCAPRIMFALIPMKSLRCLPWNCAPSRCKQDDVSLANVISSSLVGVERRPRWWRARIGALVVRKSWLTGRFSIPAPSTSWAGTFPRKVFAFVLSRDVPELVSEHRPPDLDAFLDEHGLSRSDIGSWILHTGGPAVLKATAIALALGDGDLAAASVLCVLEEVMVRRRPPDGTYSVLAAMGPGFCSELVLLRW